MNELRNREVFDPPPGVESKVRFGGVLVTDPRDGVQVFLTGPVPMASYEAIVFSGVNPRTGEPFKREGIGWKVVEVDGARTDKFWNLISRRAETFLLLDLEDGSYLKKLYGVTPVGEPPETRYTIRVIPS